MVRCIREVLFPQISTMTPAEFHYIYRRIHELTYHEQYYLFKNVPKSALPRHIRVTDQYLYLYQRVREPNPGSLQCFIQYIALGWSLYLSLSHSRFFIKCFHYYINMQECKCKHHQCGAIPLRVSNTNSNGVPGSRGFQMTNSSLEMNLPFFLGGGRFLETQRPVVS